MVISSAKLSEYLRTYPYSGYLSFLESALLWIQDGITIVSMLFHLLESA